jgi:hypothetical protein
VLQRILYLNPPLYAREKARQRPCNFF